ncbi:EAL domain-containing protein [Curvibacter sp. HBC61]|uniref:EAL domain-containing protein n=1 Tax=Curvibacter cyanobacteriorum TaxID=3026422 RepID=A0ABT5N090_9BURK|nr:EAL domain-containing protein [Curvibacter sp. HBC61]MDD0839507.1 EAL domain-containing protein [Curvibacter sp. HBC61]
MQILSASESYLLGRRFGRLLVWAAAMMALCFVGLTALSIAQDRHNTRRIAQDTSYQITENLRQLTDSVLEQASYSLAGLAEALLSADSHSHAGPAAWESLLTTAMRYDTSSQVLFVRRGEQLVAVDHRQRLSEVRSELSRLKPPEVAGQLALHPPISLDGGQTYVLPALLRLSGGASPGEWLLGALIPLQSLRPPSLNTSAQAPLDQAAYLPSGLVLMHTLGRERLVGRMSGESAQLAQLASSAPTGAFEAQDAQGQGLSGTFRRSDRYPLLVASMQSDAEVLDPWLQRSVTKGVLLLLSLTALGLGVRALTRMLRALATSESVYRRLFEDVADGVIVHSPSGRILNLNAAALRLTGLHEADEVVGRSMAEFFPHPVDPATGRPSTLPQTRIERALAGEHLRFEYSFDAPLTQQHFDCDVRLSTFTLEGEPQVLCLLRDLSEERRHSRQQEYLANHDPLTGLPNRHSLLRRLDERIEQAPGQAFELVFVNLARFKEVNEAFGHRAADMVLEISARRLERQLSAHGWTLARAGGTDFAAAPPLPGYTGPALPTEAICELMVRVVREPIVMGETSVELHLKLGSADYPGDALDAGQLLRCADMAATRARTVVGSQVRYSKSFENAPGHDLKMRSELSAAIRDGQLQLAWQPKLWLESREIEGVEALLRWHHPRLGWVPPSEFIPLAESTELIYPLTRWVVSAALDQMALWQAQGQPLKVAVNISANNLQDPDFTDHVKDLLHRKNVPAELLELEVTESALAANPEIVLRRLQDLRAAGLSLALDDFGTGFSSLSYVSQFPFTSIKIDRSFVSALLRSPRDRHVAESTIALGRKLGLRTVAEGVEDDATASALMALECDIGQGYLFARPLMGQAFEHWRSAHEAKLVAARKQASGSPLR